MKKIFALLALTLVVITGCKSQAITEETAKPIEGKVKYEYKAYTRGGKTEVVIDDRLMNGGMKSVGKGEQKITPFYVTQTEWDELLTETGKLDLDKLETISAPSKAHQFDGAPAASLTITVNDKAYRSVTFDQGNPPDEIKSLVEKMILLSKLELN
jgi:heat shock protein HslJ